MQTANGKRMTTPRVIGKTESQALESPLLGNGYGGFGEGREEPAANLWVYTERPNGDSAPTSKRNRALRLLCSINPFHRIAARWRFGMNLKGRVWAARGALGR